MRSATVIAIAALASLCTSVARGQVSEPLPDSLTYRELQITNEHRFDSTSPGMMSGHWGHHLGHLLRTRTNGLWFVDDTGGDVYDTPTARYYQLGAEGAWSFRKQITNWGNVQQNTASVAVGDTIYTYGIAINGPALVENRLSTGTLAGTSRTVKTIAHSTNYIGAAVSPAGVRIVWWSNVVDGNGPSTWFYTYNDGGGWSPIISSTIPGHNDFSYVVVAFADDSTFWAAGEAIGGYLPNWTYKLGVGRVVIGQTMTEFEVLPGSNYTACDIWCNPANGDVHVLGNGQAGNVTYYHRPDGGAWPDSALVVTDPPTIWRGTRFLDAPDGKLYIVLSTPDGLKLQFMERSRISGALNVDSLTTYGIHNNDGFNRVFAVFPERSQLQTTPVGGINFAYPGNDYAFSSIVKHIEIRRWDPVGLLDGAGRPDLRLEWNVPNPFNPRTMIRFTLPRAQHVRLTVHNAAGQCVQTLADSAYRPGAHAVVWDGRDERGRRVASGVYFCRLAATDGARIRRMVLVR